MGNKFGLNFEEIDQNSFRVINLLGKEIFHFQNDLENDIIRSTWKNFFTSEQGITVYKFLNGFLVRNQIPFAKSLTDASQIEGSFDGMNEWLVKDYMPNAIKYGLKCYATVLANDFYSQLAMEEYQEMAKELLCEKAYLNDLAEAIAWLKAREY